MDDRPTTSATSLRQLLITGLLACGTLLRLYGVWLTTLPDVAVVGGAVVKQPCSRRDYYWPRRPQARDWWEDIVPRMRENDPRRYIRKFRVPPCVVDEIVWRAATHPSFFVASWNVHRSVSVTKRFTLHSGV